MAKLKRLLAGTLAVCMAGSMAVMTSCGDTDDSSSTSSGSSTTNAGDDSSEAVVADSASLVNTGKVYNIYVWNTEFKSRFEDYYWDNRDEELWDGVEVNWITNTNDGGVYQTKLDEAIAGQNDADDDDKIDMFLVEADYALKYVNSDICLDVRSEIGISDSDMSNQYTYTQDVMTDESGTLKGLSWQATPGLFLYNTVYAEEVLGTSDPDEVQALISDWDKFEEVAAQMNENGIAMVSGFDDTYRCFSNNVSTPWVTDSTITISDELKAWVDQTKSWTDAGYNNGTSLWDDAWAAGQKIDGNTFGYFFSTWGIPFTLLPNTLDVSTDDGGVEEEGNGGYGLWKACTGPQEYFWGGTWLCGAYGSDNIAITRDIMLKLTCDVDIMQTITDKEQDYTNNKQSIQNLIDDGYSNAFLGGQDHLSLLTEAAENLDLSNKLSAYDQNCNEQFQAAMKDYFLGNSTYEEALETFKTNIATIYGDLTCDF